MNTQETFDWKQAAKYWAEGKKIERRIQSVVSYSGPEQNWHDIPEKDFGVHFESYYDYRIKVEPVKWARGAFWDVDGWHISPHACSSLDKFKECHERDSDIFIWPARFDQEGFLIIPPEMNQNKE